MLIQIKQFYIIVVSEHLYFNNKTSSALSSSINASESLSHSSSLRVAWIVNLFAGAPDDGFPQNTLKILLGYPKYF